MQLIRSTVRVENFEPYLYSGSVFKYAVKLRRGRTLIDICKDLEDNLIAIHETVEKFYAAGRRQSSTFTFWDSFIEAGELLLRLLRAERDADF